MRDSRAGGFIDKPPGGEAGQVEGAADLVMGAGRQKMRKQGSSCRNRFEASGSPAAIEEDASRRRGSDDGRRIRDDVDDAPPLAHQLQLAEGGEHVDETGDDDLLHRRIAALSVGGDPVEPAASSMRRPAAKRSRSKGRLIG